MVGQGRLPASYVSKVTRSSHGLARGRIATIPFRNHARGTPRRIRGSRRCFLYEERRGGCEAKPRSGVEWAGAVFGTGQVMHTVRKPGCSGRRTSSNALEFRSVVKVSSLKSRRSIQENPIILKSPGTCKSRVGGLGDATPPYLLSTSTSPASRSRVFETAPVITQISHPTCGIKSQFHLFVASSDNRFLSAPVEYGHASPPFLGSAWCGGLMAPVRVRVRVILTFQPWSGGIRNSTGKRVGITHESFRPPRSILVSAVGNVFEV